MSTKQFLVVAGLLILITAGIGFVAWHGWDSKHNDTHSSETKNTLKEEENRNNTQAKEEAIRQAEAYQPEGICAAVLTPAIHKATGVRYTFPSSCLAPGWEKE